MDIEGAETLDIPCFLGKSFNIQDGANTYLNKGKKYIVRRIIKHEGVGIWSWMLKEIPETLMLWAFDPLQHDLRTDMGTDGFIYLFRQNPWKYLCFPLYRTDGTDDILLKLKKKKSIYKKYYKRTVQRCVLSVLSVPFRRWEQMWTMICDSENPCEYWTFSNLPQIPQMLYYLNLKNKKNI